MKVKPWKDVYDATTERPGCIQFSLKSYQLTGTEDCLFNNIHTPEVSIADKILNCFVSIFGNTSSGVTIDAKLCQNDLVNNSILRVTFVSCGSKNDTNISASRGQFE